MPAPSNGQSSPESPDEERRLAPPGEVPSQPPVDFEFGPPTEPFHGTPSDVVVWPVIVGVPLILVLGLLLTFLLLHGRGGLKLLWHRVVTSSRRVWGVPDDVQDSEAFRRALEIWSDALVYDEPTPRTIKRFLNSLRYFAAMLHAERGEDLDWGREANLVALAAMHHPEVEVPQSATPGEPGQFQRDGGNAAVTQGSGADNDAAERARKKRILEVWRKHYDPRSWETGSGTRVAPPGLPTRARESSSGSSPPAYVCSSGHAASASRHSDLVCHEQIVSPDHQDLKTASTLSCTASNLLLLFQSVASAFIACAIRTWP